MNEATLSPPQAAVAAPLANEPVAPWSWLRRLGFRFSFSYWVLFALLNGNVTLFLVLPVIGWPIQRGLDAPGRALTQAVADSFFHLTGVAARWHPSGSGDKALDYIKLLCFVGVAAVATLAWSAADRDRRDYRTLHLWLRWLLRLTLGAAMLYYGFAKLFPLQMRPPSLGILTNTYGNSSPMTLLWTLLGLNPGYQVFCGAAEVAAGLLLLYRRTATLGTILALALSAAIVLYNFFFDVPVKLFASHLLLMAGFLLLPDLAPLWRVFVRQQAASLSGGWSLEFHSARWRKGFIIGEAVFAVALVAHVTFFTGKIWLQHRAAQEPTPLTGAWQVESIEPAKGLVSPEGEPWVALYIDDRRGGFYRSRDGALWRCGFQYDGAAQKLGIRSVRGGGDYRWELTDADHVILTRQGRGPALTVKLRRIATPASFPLLERGFHWVNEWGYER
jgi:hypothetical protein